jgi:pterin-4a-carbinolamine dehydratase/uncharacterized protein (DUF2267 family)
MIRYPEITESVTERTGLGDADDARSAIKAVLAGVAHWVDVPEREAIAHVLPDELRYIMESPRPTVGGDLPRFLLFVAFVVDATPEHAQYYSQAVVSFLCAAEPSLAGTLRRALPNEFAILFEPPRGAPPAAPPRAPAPAPAPVPVPVPAQASPPASAPATNSTPAADGAGAAKDPVTASGPGTAKIPAAVKVPAAASGAPDPNSAPAAPAATTPAPASAGGRPAPPAELTADQLADVLSRLPGWRGNTRRLTRTVTLPRGADDNVIDAIHRVEEQLNHHAQLRRAEGDLTLTLWTHSRDVVTELDIRLAERINDILARL